jgi:hypothetical protein
MDTRVFIIKEVDMKISILLLLVATMLFAVKPVPRPDNKVEVKDVKAATEIVQDKDDEKKIDKADNDKNNKDHFIDKNSDGVNDQREDDLQTIKNSQPKHKEPSNNKKATTPAVNKKPTTPKKINKK